MGYQLYYGARLHIYVSFYIVLRQFVQNVNPCFLEKIFKMSPAKFFTQPAKCEMKNKASFKGKRKTLQLHKLTRLTLHASNLGKIFSSWHFEIFFFFFYQKTGFDISCKLSTLECLQWRQLHVMLNSVFCGKTIKISQIVVWWINLESGRG